MGRISKTPAIGRTAAWSMPYFVIFDQRSLNWLPVLEGEGVASPEGLNGSLTLQCHKGA